MKLYKKLNKDFENSVCDSYEILGSVKAWLLQSGIKVKDKHIRRIIDANGGHLPYPYQDADRKRILKNLKERDL